VLIGIAYQDEKTIVPLAVDETTGALLTTSSGSGGGDVTITGPLGQMPMADSVSVAIASDQSALSIFGGGETSGVPIKDTTQYGDGVSTGILAVGNRLWNGTNYDRAKSVATGIQAVGLTDGTGNALSSTTGALNVNISSGNISGFSTSANQTNGTQQTKLTDGTNTANVVAGDTGFNGVATASATKTYTFTTSATGAQMLLANTPTEGFTWIRVVLTSAGTGLAWSGQWSSTTGGSYVTVNGWQQSNVQNSVTSGLTTSVGVISEEPVHNNFFQLNITAMTGGATTGFVILSAIAPPNTYSTVTAGQNGTWTVGSNTPTGSAVPANGFYIGGINSGNLVGAGISTALTDTQANGANALYTADFNQVYNGTTWSRQVTATVASGTTGTGLLGAGILGFDGTNFQRAKTLTDGTLNVVQSASTGTLTSVNSSATNVTVLASNTVRKGATFFNNSTQTLYLAFGATASTTAFTVPLASNAFFEMPSGYTGVVSGIWASANGNVQVTEIT
jgi:hypothetical protein